MFTFLLVVHALIAASLVGVILMQRSEGGGLGMGGGPAGLMSARGAADFLTRATAVLATLFVLMAFLMAVLATRRDSGGTIDTSLAHQAQVGPITAPAPAGSPIAGIPMAGGVPAAAASGAPAVPDATTAQALQPASAGLPAARPAPTPEQQKAQAKLEHDQAQALRKSAPISLKTIDAPKASNTSIGINGISTGGAHNAAASAPAAKPIPTLNIAAPATTPATSGNGANPQ
jgi:preprotein translocase subunit SecG